MPSWPRSLHGHLLDLEVGPDGETTYRCVECGLRVEELRAEILATRACTEAPTR